MPAESAKSDLIGQGCAASAFLYRRCGTTYVKKIFKPTAPTFFAKEVQVYNLLEQIDCIHFPKIYDIDEKNLTIIMEYCGKPIGYSRLPMNWREQCVEMSKVLDGCGIVHGDMTYPNVMVNDVGILKVIDFGCSELVFIKVKFLENYLHFQRKKVYGVLQVIKRGEKYDIITKDKRRFREVPAEIMQIMTSKRIIHGHHHNNLANSIGLFESELRQRMAAIEFFSDDFFRYNKLRNKNGK